MPELPRTGDQIGERIEFGDEIADEPCQQDFLQIARTLFALIGSEQDSRAPPGHPAEHPRQDQRRPCIGGRAEPDERCQRRDGAKKTTAAAFTSDWSPR